MEAVLMGKRVWGSDIDPHALAGAERNLKWLCDHFSKRPLGTFTLFQHDATKLPDLLDLSEVDAIVTEGYLGPPQSHLLSLAQAKHQARSLEPVYEGFFRMLQAAGFRGPVVMSFPYFRLKEGGAWFMDSFIRRLQKLGFTANELLPRVPGIPSKKSLLYFRPDQAVGRHIYRLTPNA